MGGGGSFASSKGVVAQTSEQTTQIMEAFCKLEHAFSSFFEHYPDLDAINGKYKQLMGSVSDAQKMQGLELQRQQEMDDATLKIYKKLVEKSKIKEVSELECLIDGVCNANKHIRHDIIRGDLFVQAGKIGNYLCRCHNVVEKMQETDNTLHKFELEIEMLKLCEVHHYWMMDVLAKLCYGDPIM